MYLQIPVYTILMRLHYIRIYICNSPIIVRIVLSCIFVRYMTHLLNFSRLVDTATLCTVTIGSRKRASGSLLNAKVCPFIESMFAMLLEREPEI